MANSLFPAFFRLTYVTEFFTHVSTHPCREWDEAGGPAGSFTDWNDDPVDAADMIDGFVDLLLPFHVNTTEFTQAIIYTMDTPESPPRPRGFITFTGKTGTSIAAAIPASMSQYVLRTDAFGLVKLVFLDAPVTSDFQPINVVTPASELDDLIEYVKLETNAFAGRDNGRVTGFVRATFKLNDELRKAYRLN